MLNDAIFVTVMFGVFILIVWTLGVFFRQILRGK